MNHPSEWQRIYHPKSGIRVYRHKGTGVMTDSLWKIGRVLKKPLVNFAKQAGKKVAEKSINKASDVAVKKAGDKIESILRKKTANQPRKTPVPKTRKASQRPTVSKTHRNEMERLNNLLSQL